MVRLLEGGKKIASKDVDYYDAEILKNITPEWQKATRVISNTLNRMNVKTGDVFLMWRLKEMINEERIKIEGEISNWKTFDVALG